FINFLTAPIASTLYATLGAFSLILILKTGFLKAFRKQAFRKPVLCSSAPAALKNTKLVSYSDC
ncbi:MAG: hypothetical protein ACK6BS_00605, partial [Pseudanabaena sp.]